MHTNNGDVTFYRDGDHITLQTDMGDVMIGPEDLEDLAAIIKEVLEDE